MQQLLRSVPGAPTGSYRFALVLLVCLRLSPASAQSFVNADFESGTSGWSGCRLEINPANVYGGTGSSMVAEVDGDNDPNTTADDMLLCQSISGFTIGSIYALEFDAARRQGGPTPSTVSVNVQLDNALDAVVTRTGTWNMVREHLQFTATATTHNLRITPNFTVSYGMLFDNFSITLVSALPVELLAFDAQAEGATVQLIWATASETNSAHFAVERSTDGANWSTIATLSAAGNSSSRIEYATRDEHPVRGLAYYRLNQVDMDGTENRYPAKALYYMPDAEPLLWPNPAAGVLNVRSFAAHGGVEVYNSMGQRAAVAAELGGSDVRLLVHALPSGTYTVREKYTATTIGRFIKQ